MIDYESVKIAREGLVSARQSKVDKMYADVPNHIKENTGAAYTWAYETMRDHEGAGHDFIVMSAGYDTNLVVCCFAKPEWNADHCSKGMETGSEAIVMAVCEYLCGV